MSHRLASGPQHLVMNARLTAPEYPFHATCFGCGCLLGALFFLVSMSPVLLVAGLTGPALCGILWNRSLPPAFAFSVVFQWVFTVVGLLTYYITGTFPVPVPCDIGSIELAVLLSQFGLLALACGLRIGLGHVRPLLAAKPSTGTCGNAAVAQRVAVLCMGLSVTCMFLPASLFAHSSVSQFTRRFFGFKDVLLLAAVMYGLHYRVGAHILSCALLVAWLPSFLSSQSAFSYLLFALFIILLDFVPRLQQSMPHARPPRSRRTAVLVVVALSVLLIVCGAIWNGGLKGRLRHPTAGLAAQRGVATRIALFARTAVESSRTVTFSDGFSGFAARLSSDVAYFALVLERVPQVVPHADGEITLGALRHVLMPRLLFPEKGQLGSDSRMTRRYTGLRVAGEESGTSIGIGYIGLLFADLGAPLMFLVVLAWGLLLGAMARSILALAPDRLLANAALIVFALDNTTSYGAAVAKLLGANVWSWIALCFCLYCLRPLLRNLWTPPSAAA